VCRDREARLSYSALLDALPRGAHTPLWDIAPAVQQKMAAAYDLARERHAQRLAAHEAVVCQMAREQARAVALMIPADLMKAMIAHARRDHPIEACGVLVGGDLPERHIALTNAEHSRSFFRFDPVEQVQVWTQAHASGKRVWAIYHSHTSGPAYPSRSDVEISGMMAPHHILISTADPNHDEVRVYRIEYGRVIAEQLTSGLGS